MSLQPEQALLLLNVSLPAIEREQQTTMRIVEAVPADKSDYRPDPNSMSAFDLCWHMAAAENAFMGGVAEGAFNFAPVEKAKTMADLITFYNESFEKNLAAIKNLSGQDLAKIIDFRGVFQMPAVEYLQFNLRHVIHHRGQLSVYLRPMGAKVPAIYGESYDSKAAKASQPNH
jgi:uncharacterized damage-inducible protein DinB